MKKDQIHTEEFGPFPVRVENRVRVPTQPHGPHGAGFTTVKDGEMVADLRIQVDIAKLVQFYARQAIYSKGKKRQCAHGAIVVRAYNVRLEGEK